MFDRLALCFHPKLQHGHQEPSAPCSLYLTISRPPARLRLTHIVYTKTYILRRIRAIRQDNLFYEAQVDTI